MTAEQDIDSYFYSLHRMILHHQSVNRVQKVHLSYKVTNLIGYPGNIHNMKMCVSLMLSNAFSSHQFGLTPLKTEESLMNNEICTKIW